MHEIKFISHNEKANKTEWKCPICGYHVIVGETITILAPGDQDAGHGGCTIPNYAISTEAIGKDGLPAWANGQKNTDRPQ